jgi:hypothetical protein
VSQKARTELRMSSHITSQRARASLPSIVPSDSQRPSAHLCTGRRRLRLELLSRTAHRLHCVCRGGSVGVSTTHTRLRLRMDAGLSSQHGIRPTPQHRPGLRDTTRAELHGDPMRERERESVCVCVCVRGAAFMLAAGVEAERCARGRSQGATDRTHPK